MSLFEHKVQVLFLDAISVEKIHKRTGACKLTKMSLAYAKRFMGPISTRPSVNHMQLSRVRNRKESILKFQLLNVMLMSIMA